MRPTPKLRLKKESLTELTGPELSQLAGGDLVSGATCPVRNCVYSLFADCITFYSCICTTNDA